MSITIIQPTGGFFSSTAFWVGEGLATEPPLAFFAELSLTHTPGVLGMAVAGILNPWGTGFAGTHYFRLLIRDDGSVRAQTRGAGFGEAIHPGPVIVGERCCVGGRILSSTSRFALFNGDVSAEDTTSAVPTRPLTDTIIGSYIQTTNNTYNRGLQACIRRMGIWAVSIPSVADFVDMQDADADPRDFASEGLVGYAPFADVATSLHFFAWDGGAVTQTDDLTLNIHEPEGGDITECPTLPEEGEPEPEPPVDCPPDQADEPQPCAVDWPCDLVPEDVSVELVSPTQSPGRSLTGRELVIHPDAGRWLIELIGVRVWTNPALFLWRDIESTLNGRIGTCCVPFYEAPLSGTPIVATLGDDATIGQVRLKIDQAAGADIRNGMHFQAGERGYRIVRVFGEDDDGLLDVIVRPPLRDVITTGTELDFNDPHVRMRLERDDGMALDLEHLRFGKTNVRFVEDV